MFYCFNVCPAVCSSAFAGEIICTFHLERSLANALRRESLKLDRTLRGLGLQYQQELAGFRSVQMEVQRALERLDGASAVVAPRLPLIHGSPARCSSLRSQTPRPLQSCCPNHIVCSTCNLRLRLADSVTRRFTPSLWTMYNHPPNAPIRDGHYRMPSFVKQRNLSASDNSLRYLPFM